MSPSNEGFQLLLDEPRLRRVRETADCEGVSVEQWILDSIDQRLNVESQGEKIRAFMEYVESIRPAFGGDFDSVAELRAARNARADHFLSLGEVPDSNDSAS